jgi:phosphatidate cytidylyltransferase
MKRVITAVCLALFAIYSIFFAPQPLFALIVAAMALLCWHEFAAIASASGVRGPLVLVYGAGLIAMWRPESLPLLTILLLAAALSLPDLSKSLAFAATCVLAILYVFLAWRWAYDLRAIDRYWLLYALAINWVGDVAAFYTGRTLGRHKLAPHVSPGKSWEGAAGSMVATVAAGVWYGRVTGLPLDGLQFAVLSAAANIAGQTGDLAESALKRGAGVKDSGTLLPGHGGFLDRLDSSLFTLPVVHFYLIWFGPR